MKTIYAIVLVVFLSTQAWGADCLAVRKKIAQERDMLQKRELTKQGLHDCPNDAVINFTYAYSMERFRKYDQALKHYKISVKLDPKYAKGYFGMGDMYLQLHKPGKAITAYNKGLALDPHNKRALKSMAAAKEAAREAGIKVAAASSVVPATSPPSARKKSVKAAATKARKSAPAASVRDLVKNPLHPYGPQQAVVFQQSLNQLPIIALPLQGEKMQSITFKISQKKDDSGLAIDKKMMKN